MLTESGTKNCCEPLHGTTDDNTERLFIESYCKEVDETSS